MYDVIIVGAGPAGITAAVYAGRKQLKTLVLTENIGGQAAWSSEIENYTGYQFITGPELAKKFEEHVKSFKIEIKEGTSVKSVKRAGKFFKVKADKLYTSKTVIMATGRAPRKLGIKGEEKFKNRGVTYCATCDAPIFKGKDVAVIGGGNSALNATLQLISIAKKIYLINIGKDLTGDSIIAEKVKKAKNVEIINNAESKKITGNKFVNCLEVDVKGKIRKLNVQGIFIEIGSITVNQPASDWIKHNKNGEIIINERCETNVRGFFAAGDVTNSPFKQITIAAGQGSIALLSAFEYISKTKFKK